MLHFYFTVICRWTETRAFCLGEENSGDVWSDGGLHTSAEEDLGSSGGWCESYSGSDDRESRETSLISL